MIKELTGEKWLHTEQRTCFFRRGQHVLAVTVGLATYQLTRRNLTVQARLSSWIPSLSRQTSGRKRSASWDAASMKSPMPQSPRPGGRAALRPGRRLYRLALSLHNPPRTDREGYPGAGRTLAGRRSAAAHDRLLLRESGVRESRTRRRPVHDGRLPGDLRRQPTAARAQGVAGTDRKTIITEMFKDPAHLAAIGLRAMRRGACRTASRSPGRGDGLEDPAHGPTGRSAPRPSSGAPGGGFMVMNGSHRFDKHWSGSVEARKVRTT